MEAPRSHQRHLDLDILIELSPSQSRKERHIHLFTLESTNASFSKRAIPVLKVTLVPPLSYPVGSEAGGRSEARNRIRYLLSSTLSALEVFFPLHLPTARINLLRVSRGRRAGQAYEQHLFEVRGTRASDFTLSRSTPDSVCSTSWGSRNLSELKHVSPYGITDFTVFSVSSSVSTVL